ncbi:PREDICTED: phospholipase A2 inhibitor and Ly6/PLAUR domain-containing protein-like [Nanorana parkeri]|uniref:phospholipase A2 inhibitor and Ly6/PLAUR domain-containing protein-like n=1 Tax=Nanorana parkeri TaxID=125878 RepID=UPI00085407E8|nr:PREDICTED: phospholipase A2 inhibitor and Ly6/PLAUR domain-containing protein-like [Nanorana parkeri]
MFLIAVCAALVSAGFALECERCLAINTNTCTGHYETCKTAQSRCMVTLTETSMTDGENTYSSVELVKSCASAYNCTHPATLSSKDYKVRVTRKCCDRDFCNNNNITWNKPDLTPNGVICDSCFSRNSDTCTVKTPMNCTGDETYCVHYLAWRDGGAHISVAGCASESMQKSEGKAAFRGSSVTVQSSVTSWRQDTYVLGWPIGSKVCGCEEDFIIRGPQK